MNEKYVNHLKHLLFNDAMITHAMGMNHNAMDRSCVAEDADEYVDGHVSEETVIMLMSRKPHVTINDTGVDVLSEMRESK